jgi:hypothetical protein
MGIESNKPAFPARIKRSALTAAVNKRDEAMGRYPLDVIV